jgi:hypothetical protein
MIRTALLWFRSLTGLTLILGGSYVLIHGGLSLEGPKHFFWGCIGLALVLLTLGAILLVSGFVLPRRSQ